ncbi:MAG: GAP family protein [Actinobacteria bacterium]|nr:GAP family protein [Actinomycetota bacterium]
MCRRVPDTAPAWTRSLNGVGPGRAFAIGIAMNVRPKNLTLAVGAGIAIGSASIDTVGTVVAIAFFTIVGVSTVAALVAGYLFGRTRVRPVLDRFSAWLQSNSALILHVAMIPLGLMLLGLAIWHLITH